MSDSYQDAVRLPPAGVGMLEQRHSLRSLIQSVCVRVTAIVATGIWLTACSS